MNRQMCPKCDVAVAWHLEKCPTCKTKKNEFIFTNSSSDEEKEEYAEVTLARRLKDNSGKNVNPELTLTDVVKAQNRTTHAVRAFVRFLFIQLSATTLAVFFWNMSNILVDKSECINYGKNCGGNGFLQFAAIATLLVGIIWSSNAGWNELSKSEIH